MFNLDTCRIIIWGYKHVYHTHSHIHEAFLRAFKYMGREVHWIDQIDDQQEMDFTNTLFISDHEAVKINGYWPSSKPRPFSLPLRDDCFYVIHGLNDDPVSRQQFEDKKRLSWNVYHDFSSTYMMHSDFQNHPVGVELNGQIRLAEDTPFYLGARHMDFRWATDLLPHEIQANKPSVVFRKDSDVINWVGSVWHVNQTELASFKKACDENKIRFITVGAGASNKIISLEDNIRMIRESYMAPAISGTHHLTEGYAPCRIFKNISYGQYGITNNFRVQTIFGGKLIFHPDPYQLFYEAREKLQDITVEQLHALMDEVATKHTYLNRIDSIFKAIRHLES